MTELRASRWVRIHEPGQANYTEQENIMDIRIGGNRCQAEVLYTVHSYRKAGYWLIKYLEAAEAAQLLAEIAEQITSAVDTADREDPDITVETNDWNCTIERMDTGAFKISLTWQTDEPVVRKQRRATGSEVSETPKASEKKIQGKKRGRKKSSAK